MNNKTVILLMAFLILFFSGIPSVLAKPEYLKSLNEIYGEGSCDICHVNGSTDGPRTPYGMKFEGESNHVSDPAAALEAIGSPSGEAQVTTPAATTETQSQKSPGFGIIAALAGFVALVLLRKQKNK